MSLCYYDMGYADGLAYVGRPRTLAEVRDALDDTLGRPSTMGEWMIYSSGYLSGMSEDYGKRVSR